MNTTRRSTKLLAFTAATALVLAACGGSDDDSSSDDTEAVTADSGAEPDGTEAETEGDGTTAGTDGGDAASAADGVDGGTLVWAHEQEPPDLHLDDPENNLSIASWMIQSMQDGLYGVTGSTEFFPELLAGEAEITENDDGSVSASFQLREGLVWSDGEPLTAEDIKWNWEFRMAADGEDEDGNPNYIYLLGDRTGYDTITDVTVDSDTEFTITWSEFFSGYKSIFERIYPMHPFSEDPAEAAAQLNDGLPDWQTPDGEVIPSSGPLVFDSWNKGVQMNLVRNDNYNGSVSPDVNNDGVAYVDGVQINFVTDTDAQINALQAGEAQMIFTQPQLAFEDLANSSDFTVASLAGPVFEHWGLNLNNVHLAKPEVREALAFAMNKAEVMEGLYSPLFGDLLPTEGLGNTYWMSNQSTYENHAGDAGYGAGDADSARAALESAGYADEGGTYTHPEDGPLSLRVGTTGGNRLREIQQELIQAQMAAAGIEIVIDNVEGGAYFSEVPFSAGSLECSSSGGESGNCDIWDITQFAWVGGPWPGGQTASYLGGGGNNPYGYANDEFDARAAECDALTDEGELASCYNELDTYVTTLSVDAETGLFMLPITQKPSFYAYGSDLAGAAVSPDADDAGPLVNVVDYQFAG